MDPKEVKYRREVRGLIDEILEKKNLTMQEISVKVKASVTSLSRWRNEKKSPRKKKFLLLKQLAEGNIPIETQEDSIVKDTLGDRVEDLKNQLEAFRKDKNDLMDRVGRMSEKIEKLEEAVFKKKHIHH